LVLLPPRAPPPTLLPYTTLFRSFLFAACTNKPGTLQIMEQEVMDIHDEVMPKMSDIHKSRKQLQIALENGADSMHVFTLLRDLEDRKSTRLNSSHVKIPYAVFCL